MGNRDQELATVSDALTEMEQIIKTLKGMGYGGAVEAVIENLFPAPEIREINIDEAQNAFQWGGKAYRAGKRFVDWTKQPIEFQEKYRAGWLSQAMECAILKDNIDDIFENAAEHQYSLEAAKRILVTEAMQTRVSSRRFHFLKISTGLEANIASLRKITGQDEILTTKEGQPEGGATVVGVRAANGG